MEQKAMLVSTHFSGIENPRFKTLSFLKMTPEIPGHYQPQFSSEEIAQKVQEVATRVTPWLEEAHEKGGCSPLALCILRGGALFFADLVRAVPISLELAFCRCRTYSSLTNTLSSETIRVDIDSHLLKDRYVLLVDDICDTGRTLAYLKQLAFDQGAIDVHTSVFIYRRHPESHFAPDSYAAAFENEDWFVGYGMEDKNRYMNLGSIYTIPKPEQG